MRVNLRLFSLLLFLALVFAPTTWASGGSRLTGVVTDPSGAVVPNAVVALKLSDTGTVLHATTDAQGAFVLLGIAPGSYMIEVTSPGFEPYRKTGLVITDTSALNIGVSLRLIAVTTSISVDSDAAQAQVESSDTTLGQTINAEQATQVPLNGRSYTDLLSMQSGVTPATTNAPAVSAGAGSFGAIAPSGDLNPGQLSINGQRESANGFLLNGANVVESIAGAAAIIPNLDSIAEFRILTSNFDAQYGNYSGGLVNVVTKQGTDKLHGSVFEFLRNTNFDARGFFDPTRAAYDQNQFGMTLGGPIQKGKWYFFADYQGNRTTEGVETGQIPVPTLAERMGSFSSQASALTSTFSVNGTNYTVPTTVAGSYLAANVLSPQLGYAVSVGEPYYFTSGENYLSGNGVGTYSHNCVSSSECVFPNAVIPQSAWSAPAKNLLQYIPAANNGGGTFSSASNTEHIHDDKTSARIDGHTRLGALSGYYFYDRYNLDNPYPVQQGGANVPGFNATSSGVAQLVRLDNTTTIGSSMVNDAMFSYMRNVNIMGTPVGGLGVSLASQGFASSANGGIEPVYPNQQGVEPVVFNSFTFGTTPFSNHQTNQTFGFSDTFSDAVGRHLLVAGVQGHFDRVLQQINLISNGEFQFFGTQTGLDFADFLLGLPSSYQQSYTPAFDNRNRYFGLFAQDSWRVNPSLTVNYGLRWEYLPAWSLAGNQSATFIPGDQSLKFPGAPTGYVFPGDAFPDGSEIPSSIARTSLRDFSPRLGLAWTPHAENAFAKLLTGGPGKTSIRTGFGRFFTAVEGLTTSYQTGNPPYGLQYASPEEPLFAQPFVGSLTGTVYPQPFPLTEPQPNVSRSNPDNNVNWSTFEPLSGAVGYYYKNPVPYALNYFLSVERQVGANTVATLNYLGSESHHLVTLLSSNPGNPALCLSLSQPSQVAAGSPTCGPFGESNVFTTASGSTVKGTRTELGPNFGSDAWFYNYGNSSYNSLQASIHHTSTRWMLMMSYTLGKSLDDASNLQEQLYPSNYKLRRAVSSFDIRHNFVASYRYNFPFDTWWAKKPRLTRGWSLTGITRFSSGLPVTMVDFGDNSLIGSNNQGVNGSGSDLPNLAPGPLNLNHHPANGNAYVNTSLFSPAPLGSPGNASRRPFYGPGMENFDMALLKTTPLWGDRQLELRWETFNTFNHSQFFGASSINGNINSPTFGYVANAMPARIMQVAAKFEF